MLKDPVTVLVQSMVVGPNGARLKPGQVVTLDDSPYVRILVKSGTVSLIDPPSFDMDFLEKAGYELRDGYSYPTKEEPEDKGLLKRKPKTRVVGDPAHPPAYRPNSGKEEPQISEEPKKVSEEKEEEPVKEWVPKEITGM